MRVTSRIKKNILRAAIFLVPLFVASISARGTERPQVTRVKQLPSPATVGRIEIPAVGLATRVLEGAEERTLRLAVGHISDTAIPGPSGNVGLAGHRDTYFRRLQKISLGDEIRYSTAAGIFTYRVVSLRIVLPEAIEVLAYTQRPTLTLVTCFPFGASGDAPERFIVHAEMVSAFSEVKELSN